MASSGRPTVGIDIGSNMIKVVEAAPGRNGVTIKAVGIAPTPPGSMENNVIIDAQLIGQALKKLLRDSGISTKSSVSSVSGQSALVVRVIEVPAMSDTELGETMKWEVERHVPFAANEVIMDFQQIQRPETPPDAQNVEVLLVVAQQDMVDRHVEALQAAGLTLRAIDVEPLAASRALIGLSGNPFGQKTVAIVNIGENNTDIGIFKDGLLSFPRTLPLAGSNLTRAISGQMGVTEEQAEELKRNYGEVILDQVAQPAPAEPADDFLGFTLGGLTEEEEPEAPAAPERVPFDFTIADDNPPASPAAPAAPAAPIGEEAEDGLPSFDLDDLVADDVAPTDSSLPAPVVMHDPTKVQVFTAMAPVLGELLAEVRRSIEYFRGRAADGNIDEILVCGGSSKIKNIAQFLGNELGISARVANPFEFTTVAAKGFSSEYLEDVAPMFVVAVGLAVRDMVAAPPVVASPAGGGGKRGRKKK